MGRLTRRACCNRGTADLGANATAAVLTQRELATLEHESDEESLGPEERQVLGA